MNKPIFLFLFFITLFSTTACHIFQAAEKPKVTSKSVKTELMRVSESKSQPEEKMDFLFNQYVNLVQEGLQNSSTAKGAETIQKFQAQNKLAVDKIVLETNTWIDKLDKKQSQDLGLRVVKKNYTRQFLDNVPAFNKKYKSYPAITEGVSKVMGIFTNIRSKAKG
jgi:hypothetical protein